MNAPTPTGHARLQVLDGWRAVSILSVLACHLLPLGPHAWQLNVAAGPFGMAIFFTLSGFLITRFLVKSQDVVDFVIRRLFRVVPLAWLAVAAVSLMAHAGLATWLTNLSFVANVPPMHLTEPGAHLWSLSIEMQFYVVVALIVWAFGRRGLWALPVLGIAVTAIRVVGGAEQNIATYYRVDEILAGATLALAYSGWFGPRAMALLGRLNLWVVLGLYAVSTHPSAGFMNYLRPYLAAAMVGITLVRPPAAARRVLELKSLAYIATVSYALYIVHVPLLSTWLGEGASKVAVYAKRPLVIVATFALAHLSTFHFEQPMIERGRRLSERWRRRATEPRPDPVSAR